MFDYVFRRKKTWISVLILDLVGSILCFFRTRELPREIRKILVVRLDHLGDLVMSTPFFKKLRELYPAAEIHLLADAQYLTIFEGDPRFDQLIPIEDHWLSRRGPVRWFRLFQQALDLRKVGYDLGFDLRGDIRSIFFFLYLAGVKFRVSYGVRGGNFLLNHSPLYPHRTHEITKNLALLSSFANKEITPEAPSLEVDPEVKKMMISKLDALGRDPSKKLIAVHLGAGYPSKQWGIEKFESLLENILDLGSYQILLVGQKDEIAPKKEFLDLGNVINCLGQTSLRELVSLISLADFFIGNDSGPAHLASAVNVPVLAVFSGTNRVEEFRPWGERSQIIHKDLECSPCEEKICPLRHHHCMELISVDEVFDAFRRLEKEVYENRI